jgi:hypothetical protein
MNTRYEGRSVRRAWARAGLLFLAATTLNGSLWAPPECSLTLYQRSGVQNALT